MADKCEIPPILKEYKIEGDLGDFSFFVFPEDFKVSYTNKYTRLNKYGIYPYYNVRTHTITFRYSNVELINTIKSYALNALQQAKPLIISCPSDPLQNTIEGFIDFPLEFSGTIGDNNDLLEGFTITITEATDHFRTIEIGTLEFHIPPDIYNYQQVGSEPTVMYSSGTNVIYTPGLVQKGFSVNLPTIYSETLEILKGYKETALKSGLPIVDNVGNSFSGLGYITAISYAGAIEKHPSDNTQDELFYPNGVSFSVLSVEFFLLN